MGCLRTLFAITVVLSHSYGFIFVGGRNAVQLFYMISGFLISYVLTESKAYPKVQDFYVNRYLRIYPIYFAVAILTLLTSSGFIESYTDIPFSAAILLIFSNIFIFLQDIVMFTGVVHNKLVFVTNYYESTPVLCRLLIIPQAWTLGVELAFYLVAPFVLTKRNVIYILLIFSIGIRIILFVIGLALKDPWLYRFFPTELAVFLLGALSHQILLPFYKKKLHKYLKKVFIVATYFFIAFTLLYSYIPLDHLFKWIFLFVVFLFVLPLIFLFQTNYKMDKWIGDLSYPIYIGHMFVKSNLHYVLINLGIDNKVIVGIINVILSIVFAIILNIYVGKPFEKVRMKFKKVQAT